MSSNTTLNVVRGGNTITFGIPVQIDNMSVEEAHYYIGKADSPFDAFNAYVVWGTPDIRRLDLLVDPANPDPDNYSRPTQYRVVGNPDPYPDGHLELKIVRFKGA